MKVAKGLIQFTGVGGGPSGALQSQAEQPDPGEEVGEGFPCKLGQLIPVAGAAIGAGVNYWFTEQTARTATMLFRSLYLERKERL